MKKRKLMSLLLASAAAVTMMSGCSDNLTSPEPAQSGTSSEGSGDYNDLVQMIKDLSDEVSQLRNMISLAPGILNGEQNEISEEEGKEIDRLIQEDEQNFLSSPPEVTSVVNSRDWSRYTSQTAKEKLSYAEGVFYDRLDEVCRAYLEDPSHGVAQWSNFSSLKGVMYSDLSLTTDAAIDVYRWFRYNNPQYYFINHSAYTNDNIYPKVMDYVLELSDVAETTNTMFDKLDSWIDECCDDETTTWQKVCSINQKICEAVIYDPKVSNRDKKYTKEETNKAAGGKNQTIYSVLMSPETVCAGYATTFNAMANAVDVDSLVTLSDTHAWNAVRFDDESFYFVDVCWNDRDNGFDTNWIGVGSQYVNLHDPQNSHVYQTGCVQWCPVLPDSSYNVTEKDNGTAEVSVAKPEPGITGSGAAGIKVEWNAVENAKQYYVSAKDENDYVVQKFTKDTFMYIPYASSSESLTVYVCAQCENNGSTVSSDWGIITCSDKGAGTKPGVPSDISSSVNSQNGLTLTWNTSAKKSVLFCFGNDSTFSKMYFSYSCEKQIGFSSYNPEEETYFALASISEEGGKEIFSEPVRFSYSKGGGLKMISGSAAVENSAPAAPENFTVNVVSLSSGRAVECTWNSVSGADGYEFILSPDADFSHIGGRKICQSDETSASYRISDKSEHLYFRVRTIKGSGDSAVYSEWTTTDIVTPEVTSDMPEKPDIPANIKMTSKDRFITFTWDEVQGADGYIFTMFNDPDYTEVRTTLNSNEEKITVGRFVEGKTYYCGVQAVVSKNGKDVYSNYRCFTFTFHEETNNSNDTELPKNITITYSDEFATFKWDDVQGATGYVFALFKDSDYKEIQTTINASKASITVGRFTEGKTYYCGIQTVASKDGEDIHSAYAAFSFTFKG